MTSRAVPGVEIVRAVLSCGARKVGTTWPRWIQASKRPPPGLATLTMRMVQLPACIVPAAPGEKVMKTRRSPLKASLLRWSMRTVLPPGRGRVEAVPTLIGPTTVPAGLTTEMRKVSAPRYQRSIWFMPASPGGWLKRRSTVVPAPTVPSAWQREAPALPADFTKARPGPPSRLSSPRSSSVVPSCGPRLSPRLMLMAQGRVKVPARWYM